MATAKVQGKPSTPPPEYPVAIWRCRGCGKPVPIRQSPTALSKGRYKHLPCGNYYMPEPGTETEEA